MINYHLVTAILASVLTFIIFWLLRKDYLHPLYSVWWFLIALAVFIFGFYPRFSDKIAQLFHIAYPPIFIVILAICIIFIKMLTMDLERSKQKTQLKKLAQKIALLEKELEKIQTLKDKTSD